MREDLFYRSRPGMSGMLVLLWRIICFCSILLFIFLFDEMPGIAVMAIFGFFASLVAVSQGSIEVEEDRFIIGNKRILLELSDREEMPFFEIAEIEARLSVFRQRLRISYEDGTVSSISLLMDRAMAREALQRIRKNSAIRVEVTGGEVFKKIMVSASSAPTGQTARSH
jgi:hypothetical protein